MDVEPEDDAKDEVDKVQKLIRCTNERLFNCTL